MNSPEDILRHFSDSLIEKHREDPLLIVSYYEELLATILKNNVPSVQRWGVAMTLNDFCKRINKNGN